jgi:hypothetical protein
MAWGEGFFTDRRRSMDARKTVRALMDSIQEGDFAKARSFLSSDFEFSEPVAEPVGAEAWLGMSMNMKKAFPNLEYHFRVESVQSEGVVKISTELRATHRGDLDLTRIKMGVIPATNKSFTAAREHGRLIVKGDKVSSWTVRPTKGAGWGAILDQLGVQLPAM